ncbi:hypothetical protein B0H19DRAFT_359012 [Mycena capillaripes]|nr:hypothetical protein B0H19DRAFT_359012 [Mycena capillaripes]
MHRGMSYRKPVPVYVPSPPPSPSASQSFSAGHLAEERPPLPEHWHDAIAQARRTYDNKNVTVSISANSPSPQHGGHVAGHVQFEPLMIVPRKDDDAPQLPRIASPVYLGSNFGMGQHRIYRPPTPPRPSDPKWGGLFDPESQNISEVPSDTRSKVLHLSSRRSQEVYAWSIGTAESSSRRQSSISLPSSEWQVAEISTERNTEGNVHPMWWDKLKTLGVLIKNRMKGFKEYGAFF